MSTFYVENRSNIGAYLTAALCLAAFARVTVYRAGKYMAMSVTLSVTTCAVYDQFEMIASCNYKECRAIRTGVNARRRRRVECTF